MVLDGGFRQNSKKISKHYKYLYQVQPPIIPKIMSEDDV